MRRWKNRLSFLLIAALCLLFTGCSSDETEVESFNLFPPAPEAASEDGITYFVNGGDIYRWKVGKKDASLWLEDAFTTSWNGYLAVLDGDLYYVDDGLASLCRVDGKTGDVETLAELWDPESPTPVHFFGQMWPYDGKLYCAAPASDDERQLEVQVREPDGRLLARYPLPVHEENVTLQLAYGEWVFYSEPSGVSYAYSLSEEWEMLLLRGAPCVPKAVIGEKLLLQTSRTAYDWLDSDGHTSPYAWDVQATWAAADEEQRFYFYPEDGVYTLYRLAREGASGPLISCDYPPTGALLDGVYYLTVASDLKLENERLTFFDRTGENARQVEQANETRIFENDGQLLSFAIHPDGEIALLACQPAEDDFWCDT